MFEVSVTAPKPFQVFYLTILQNKESIEEETGFEFDWRELPERKASRIVLTKPVDFGDKSQWGAQFTWIEDVMLKMKKAFKKYL